MVRENIEVVRRNIRQVCERCGRRAEDITLIAVSKTKPFSSIQEAQAAGQRIFGENHVQEILDKTAAFPELEWHMIGHLQRNKVRQVIGKVSLIHSLDSLRLADQIEKEAAKMGITVPVLLEINVAKEESKYGFFLEDAERVLKTIAGFPHIQIKGLMTIAPFVEDPEENRLVFRKLYEFFIATRAKNIDNVSMDHLSMGMTNDYPVAIEEGATMVRVGTGIFGERQYR